MDMDSFKKSLDEGLASGMITQADYDRSINSPDKKLWAALTDEECNAHAKSYSSEYDAYRNFCRIRSEAADGLVRSTNLASFTEEIQKQVLILNCMDCLSKCIVPSAEIVAHLPILIESYEGRAKMFHDMGEKIVDTKIKERVLELGQQCLSTAQYLKKMREIRQTQGKWPK